MVHHEQIDQASSLATESSRSLTFSKGSHNAQRTRDSIHRILITRTRHQPTEDLQKEDGRPGTELK